MSIKDKITKKLEAAFSPDYLEVINESDKHIGHAGHDGSGDSHFKVFIVASVFEKHNRIERQRMLHSILEAELQTVIHALSLRILSPLEVKRDI